MYLRERFAVILFPFVLAAVGIAFLPSSASAACERPGSVEITDATRTQARNAGIPDFCTQWIPGQPYVGQEAGEAKTYLKNVLCRADGDNYGGYGPDATVDNLNPEFAKCAAKFIRDYSAQLSGAVALRSGGGNPICLKEGARTVQKQNEYVNRGVLACKQGARCEHPSGIAIDINTSSQQNYARLHAAACAYGLVFYMGMNDEYHFVPASNRVGKKDRITCPPAAAQINCADPNFRPQTDLTPSSSPTATFAQTVRNWLTPQQQVQAIPSQPAMPSQPVSTSQNPLDAFNPPSITPQLTPTSTNATSTNAAADRLEELAFGGQPTTTNSTATSVPLVVSGSDAAMLTGTQQASTTSVTTQGVISPSQTTFTSGDLAWQDETVSSNPVSGVQAIIITIRAALNRISQYLVPFGARNSGGMDEQGVVQIVE